MKNKVLNKKGYILVYVIGLVTLFIFLSASLMSFTMTRTNWVNNNVKNIKLVSKVKSQVEAAASELGNYFEDYVNVFNLYLYQLDAEFELVFTDIEDRYGVTIRDLTKLSCEYPDNPDKPACYPVKLESYTYAYEIVYEEGGLIAQKRFFLSMIPSFLYFALGSKSDLTINGGAYIHGDIYVNNNLYLTDIANYIITKNINNEPITFLESEPTTFLTVNSTNNLYLKNNLYSCHNQELFPCYTNQASPRAFIRNDSNYTRISTSWELTTTFVNEPPAIKTYSDRFLDVNFDSSFIYYINEAIDDENRDIDINNLDYELSVITNIEKKLYPAEILDDLADQTALSVIFDTSKLLIDRDVTFIGDNKWIIVNGDLEIAYYNLPAINVDANFLVTGDITIAGNVKLNSTIYAIGKGLIHNANINNSEEDSNNQLVLLTKDTIQFSKINQFDNKFYDRIYYDSFNEETIITPDIKGFFYTERNIQIFTIDSYIAIEGGVFASDVQNTDLNNPTDFIEDTNAIGIVINSYRGSVFEDRDTGDFIFYPPQNYLESRLIIKHNPEIIRDQPKGLPLNKQINYLFEDVTVK